MFNSVWLSLQKNMISFQHPVYPGDLNIPYNTPHIKDLTMRNNHREESAILGRTVDVDRTLKNQVGAAIDKLYLKELFNLKADMIIMILDALLTHFFASYSLVNVTKFSKEYQNVSLVVFILNYSPVIV